MTELQEAWSKLKDCPKCGRPHCFYSPRAEQPDMGGHYIPVPHIVIGCDCKKLVFAHDELPDCSSQAFRLWMVRMGVKNWNRMVRQ